jgi:hypothetical protein
MRNKMKIGMILSAARLLVIAAALTGGSSARAATVAYWRFETGPANSNVLHPGADGTFSGVIPDVSGNGNDLSVWSQGGGAGFAYRSDVPAATVPINGAPNLFSVKNTGSYPAMFTSAAGSSPTGINAETMTPAQFTVEVSYKPEASASYRTIVGRDAKNIASVSADLAAFYLQIRPDDSFCASFTDMAGYTHTANSPPGWAYGFNFSANPEGVGAPWYHIVAVSDGSTLKLFVNNQLVGTNDLIASGSPNRALAKGSVNGADWTTGAWSVGRGLYAGGHTDRAYGLIDEVRISNSALTPGQFLFAPRPVIANCRAVGNNLTFDVSGGQPGVACLILRSVNAAVPTAQWPAVSSKVFDANGNFSFSTPILPDLPFFYALKFTPQTAVPAGALTYSLNGDWPADAKARIIYALDGAVAEYNRYGTFKEHVTANYSPGTPTADGSFGGWINFGSNASYQNMRTALHEIGHTLGMGTTWQWDANLSAVPGVWIGANGVAQAHAFDGPNAQMYSDGTHFWGINGGGSYGLNYDSEGSTENFRRHVLMMAAFRKDMGLQ